METQNTITEIHNEENLSFLRWPYDLLVDYVLKIHHRGIRTHRKEIMALLDTLCTEQKGSHPSLAQVRELFIYSMRDLELHLEKEEQMLFPYFYSLFEAYEQGKEIESIHCGEVSDPIEVMMSEHNIETKRYETISSLTGGYACSKKDTQEYCLLMQKLSSFQRDLQEHVFIENQIVFPAAIREEEEMAQKGLIK